MVKIEDLMRIGMLKDFPEHLLEIMAKEAQLSIFGTDTRLVTLHEPIDTFYMLIMGQVSVKRELTPEIDMILDFIQSGSSFGTSALLEGGQASYTAVCEEPCEVITLSGPRMMELFETNHELAYYMLRGVSRQYKKSMDLRARMIMKTLDENPDLEQFKSDQESFTVVI